MNPPSIPNSRDALKAAPTILLVDDNTEFLEVLERRFKRRGFDVVACNDAAAAKSIDRHNLDVAIIDRGLRVGNGIDLLKELKRGNVNLAVIILSGNSEQRNVRLAMESGAFEYIAKPCSLVDLETAVRRALDSMTQTHANSHTACDSARSIDYPAIETTQRAGDEH